LANIVIFSLRVKKRSIAEQKFQATVTIDQLVDILYTTYRIDRQTLIAKGKQQPAAEARAIAAYLVQNDKKLSLTEPGEHFKAGFLNIFTKKFFSGSILSLDKILIYMHTGRYGKKSKGSG